MLELIWSHELSDLTPQQYETKCFITYQAITKQTPNYFSENHQSII